MKKILLTLLLLCGCKEELPPSSPPLRFLGPQLPSYWVVIGAIHEFGYHDGEMQYWRNGQVEARGNNSMSYEECLERGRKLEREIVEPRKSFISWRCVEEVSPTERCSELGHMTVSPGLRTDGR